MKKKGRKNEKEIKYEEALLRKEKNLFRFSLHPLQQRSTRSSQTLLERNKVSPPLFPPAATVSI